jgi:hypothetical protein
MMPDITPWSYPNRKTPNDTNTVVKYLETKVSMGISIADEELLTIASSHEARVSGKDHH